MVKNRAAEGSRHGCWDRPEAVSAVTVGDACLPSLAIRRVTAIEGILIPMLEPVLNPLWVFIFLGEKPGVWTVAGAMLVLGAMLSRGLLGLRRRTAG